MHSRSSQAKPTQEQILRFFLDDARHLANIYWFIRYARFHKDVRKHYRRAAKEKGRLRALGYDSELIRLYRLYLRNPHCEKRHSRFLEHCKHTIYAAKQPVQLTLF